jgi:ribonuclease HI
MHALWTCPELLSAWVPHTLARKLTRRRYLSLLDVLSDLFMLGTVESIAEFCFTLWLLWNRRNKALYRNEFDPLCSIPQLAASLSSEFLEAHKTEAPILPAPPTPIWKPPSHCAYKINFDAALSSANVRTGVGVIIRDGRGLPIATLCKHFQCLHAVDDVEAIAAREAIQFTVEIGISKAEVEGDSLTICTALQRQDSSYATFGVVLEDVCLLASSFQRCSFSHVKREGNRIAHMLTRRALDLHDDFIIWLEDNPENS